MSSYIERDEPASLINRERKPFWAIKQKPFRNVTKKYKVNIINILMRY